MGERLLVSGLSLGFYVVKLIWPINLTFNYPRWQLNIRDPIQWIWVLGVAIYLMAFWWKRQTWGRGPFVGLAFFSVTLAPALGFFNVYPMRYSFVADHFQYLASIGILALIVGSIAWGFDRQIKSDTNGKGRILDWVRPVLALSVLAVLAALTWKQGLIYRSHETLWQDTLNKNPGSLLAHNNLGVIYGEQGRLEEALQEYLIVLSLQPDDIEAHNNLGTVYGKQGRLEEAVREYLAVLKLKPGQIETHYNLGNVYKLMGLKDEARKQFEMVLKLDPDFNQAQEAFESPNSRPETHARK
jgi:tetratricopeptide (TPR) repeat protein